MFACWAEKMPDLLRCVRAAQAGFMHLLLGAVLPKLSPLKWTSWSCSLAENRVCAGLPELLSFLEKPLHDFDSTFQALSLV